jgi:hypothetical protein
MAPRILSRSCCTTPSAMAFWTVMLVLFFGVGLLLRSVFPSLEPFADTAILSALAAACFANYRRNRTLHCGLTGPLFLGAAIVMALVESGASRIDELVLWALVLVGVAIALVIEWRTVRRQERTSNV